MDRPDRYPKVRTPIPRFKKRRQISPGLKAKVGLEALKVIEPVHAIAAKFRVHPLRVSHWKQEAAERLPEVFLRKADLNAQEAKEREKELFKENGRLKMELEWSKKIWPARALRSDAA